MGRSREKPVFSTNFVCKNKDLRVTVHVALKMEKR